MVSHNIYRYPYIYFLLLTIRQVLEILCNVQCYRFTIPWNNWEQLNITNQLCDTQVNIYTHWEGGKCSQSTQPVQKDVIF